MFISQSMFRRKTVNRTKAEWLIMGSPSPLCDPGSTPAPEPLSPSPSPSPSRSLSLSLSPLSLSLSFSPAFLLPLLLPLPLPLPLLGPWNFLRCSFLYNK